MGKMMPLKDIVIQDTREFTGVDLTGIFELGMIKPEDVRSWLIKRKYFEMARRGMNYTEIKIELSIRYDITVSAIEKMIYKKERHGLRRNQL